MELRVDTVKVPERIGFNYEELKQQLTDRCREYEMVVYTDDTIKAAKVDRAMLNKLKDNLNAERLRRQREYMHPFDVFKAQVDDLISIINRASGSIDRQVKDYEGRQKQQKIEEIRAAFDEIMNQSENAPEWLTFEMINDPKWALKSKTVKTVREEMDARLHEISDDIRMIGETFRGKEFEDAAVSAAMAKFKRSLDFRSAVNAGTEVQEEMKSAQEAQASKASEEASGEVQLEAAESEPVPPSHPAEAHNPVPQKKRIQRVTVVITAEESQFRAVNDLFAGLKRAGAKFEIISKEEL